MILPGGNHRANNPVTGQTFFLVTDTPWFSKTPFSIMRGLLSLDPPSITVSPSPRLSSFPIQTKLPPKEPCETKARKSLDSITVCCSSWDWDMGIKIGRSSTFSRWWLLVWATFIKAPLSYIHRASLCPCIPARTESPPQVIDAMALHRLHQALVEEFEAVLNSEGSSLDGGNSNWKRL